MEIVLRRGDVRENKGTAEFFTTTRPLSLIADEGLNFPRETRPLDQKNISTTAVAINLDNWPVPEQMQHFTPQAG